MQRWRHWRSRTLRIIRILLLLLNTWSFRSELRRHWRSRTLRIIRILLLLLLNTWSFRSELRAVFCPVVHIERVKPRLLPHRIMMGVDRKVKLASSCSRSNKTLRRYLPLTSLKYTAPQTYGHPVGKEALTSVEKSPPRPSFGISAGKGKSHVVKLEFCSHCCPAQCDSVHIPLESAMSDCMNRAITTMYLSIFATLKAGIRGHSVF